MATNMTERWFSQLDELRYAPTAKRVRAFVGGELILDTDAALVVWEPRRVVPLYAIPEGDLRGSLGPADLVSDRRGDGGSLHGRPVLAVGEFDRHTTGGESLAIRATSGALVAAFRPADPDLHGHVIVDFDGPDTWLEEDEAIFSHPRDPYHRVDVRRSARQVRVERDGALLAESNAARLVFETNLPTRYYLPGSDVDEHLLRPSPTSTSCAYKGHASYFSVVVGERLVPDLAWTYREPLPDAAELRDLVAFFDERVDLIVDGSLRERPQTPWSRDD